MNRVGRALAGLIACTLICFTALSEEPGAPIPSPAERGKYLTDAGNCFSCHTKPGGAPFAGGLAFDTPFGTIYSPNITPDPLTGIGQWTALDLRRAMHEGVGKDGIRLFPAFPYTSYTKVTDQDVDAIYAYLRTLKPVRYTPPANGLLFSMRWPLALWNASFFREGRYQPNPSQSSEWNRGAYLVEGLGHCSACHTPRNWFMAEDDERTYTGGVLQAEVAKGKARTWSAVNLSSAKIGLGSWSLNDLAKYLQTGFSPRAGSFGPMNEVILNSLKNLTSEDVHAMAVYLKSLPTRDDTDDGVPAAQAKAGEPIYKDHCEKCHSSSGRGGMFAGPPLAGSAVVQAGNPASLINVILYGPDLSKGIPTGAWETMPAYNDVLNDAQTAAVANYIRGSWRNHGSPVTESEAAQQR
jgi:alcohol dehydrogenase (quinone), cytochrome c subunit